MPPPRSASHIANDAYLMLRADLLTIAATRDRIDEAGELDDAAMEQMRRIDAAIEIVADTESGRAERLQRLFSRPYQAEWRTEMQIDAPEQH